MFIIAALGNDVYALNEIEAPVFIMVTVRYIAMAVLETMAHYLDPFLRRSE